jgi:uncharacterized protein (DUF1800 family)
MQAGLSTWMEDQLATPDQRDELLEAIPSYYVTNEEVVRRYPRMGDIFGQAVRDGVMDTKRDRFNMDTKRKMRKYGQKHGYRRQRELYSSLISSRTVRAVNSRYQVREVMVDFWLNHFSVPASNNRCRPFVLSFERDAIRPNSLGSFRKLLGATAKHPAMLLFLENATSTVDVNHKALSESTMAKSIRLWVGGGINENYARELLELHTLGSDAGYTQDDVKDTARILTGWTCKPLRPKELRLFELERSRLRILELSSASVVKVQFPVLKRFLPTLLDLHLKIQRKLMKKPYFEPTQEEARRDFELAFDPYLAIAPVPTACPFFSPSELSLGEGFSSHGFFVFFPYVHDSEQKSVLGKTFPAGRGLDEGEELLDFLGRHPATARRIAKSFATKFYSDSPEEEIIEKLAVAFQRTDGEVSSLIRTLLESPEFWEVAARKEKVKAPLGLLASAVRALDGDLDAKNLNLFPWSAGLGQPLYSCPSPEGYSSLSQDMLNMSTVLKRMEFGEQLLNGEIPGVAIDLEGSESDSSSDTDAMVRHYEERLWLRFSEQERTALLKALSKGTGNSSPQDIEEIVLGTLLSSPDFQRN